MQVVSLVNYSTLTETKFLKENFKLLCFSQSLIILFQSDENPEVEIHIQPADVRILLR